jgi:hypothetical protein
MFVIEEVKQSHYRPGQLEIWEPEPPGTRRPEQGLLYLYLYLYLHDIKTTLQNT